MGGVERLRRAADGAAVQRDRAARAWNRADDRPTTDCNLVDRPLLDRGRPTTFLEPPERGGLHDDENAEALRGLTEVDEGARRLGELALVDGEGRIGLLDTVFYNTLLDENASSHIALGNGFSFLVEGEDRERANVSAQHIDFMIGSAELDVDGVTADGERVPVLRNLAWQL
ncbi:MAG: aminopeptidase [Gaiellaceae bacterium]